MLTREFILVMVYFYASCLVPSIWTDDCHVTAKSYTANDGLVLVSTGHIITFSANCPKDVIPAYANLNGRTISVVHSEGDRSYQISWTTDLSTSSSGSYEISVFDENGFQQFKKAQRSGSSDVKPLFTIPFHHQSPYRGPIIRTEFTVLIITLIISYYAINLRFKIMNKKI